ncbi:MAG TPA: tetratricopeptide repeat protein, partial [Chloroflexia bacterium]|nr:tetratricopeptide repeat protein [Chloroflexia bacterium]
MAGNKAAFDAAMKRAQDYAFENAWDKALREYQRALDEFPDDANAQTNMAQALFRLQQWPAALQAYNNLLRVRPSDPFVLNRIAECQVSLQQPADAERTYMQVATVYGAQNQIRDALGALRTVLGLNAGNRLARERMAEIYRNMGERNLAIQEYLTLSRQALESQPEDLDLAVRHAETAFGLDNSHPEARDWLYRLRRRQLEATGTQFDEKTLRIVSGPGQAAQRDLQQMYDLAMQYQEKNQFAAARVQLEAAQAAGLDTAALHYSLGLIYQQERQFKQAVEQLQKAAGDPEYAMSSQYALGECYRTLGQRAEATRAYEAAISLVDLQHVGKNEVNDLIELYQAAADAHLAQGNTSRAASLYSTLATFLQARRWRSGFTDQLMARADELNDQGISDRLQSIGGAPEPAAKEAPPAPEPRRAPAAAAVPVAPEFVSSPQGAGSVGARGGTGQLRSGMLRPITDFLSAQDLTPPDAETAAPAESAAAPKGVAARVAPPGANGATARTSHTLQAVLADEGMPLDGETAALVDVTDALIDRGLWNAAIDCCYEVIRLDAEYLPIHLRLAEIFRQSGRREDAILKLQSVIDVYMVRGDMETAAQVFPELIALQPENVNIRTKLATLLMDLGQHDAAVNEYLSMADMHYSTGQREQALEELRRLRSIAPQNPEVRLRAGLYLLRADRPADALPEFSRALQIDPENKLALTRVFVTMVLLGNDTQWDVLETLQGAAADYGDRQAILEDLRGFALTGDRPELFYALAVLNDLPVPAEGLDEEARTSAEQQQLRAQTEALDDGLGLLPVADRSFLGLLMRARRARLALDARDGDRALRLLTEAMNMLESERVT